MSGFQKFISKFVCVVVVLSAVVGGSERAWGESYSLETALMQNQCTGSCVDFFYEFITSDQNSSLAQSLFSLLNSGNMAGASVLIRTIITLMQQTIVGIGGIAIPPTTGDKDSGDSTGSGNNSKIDANFDMGM